MKSERKEGRKSRTAPFKADELRLAVLLNLVLGPGHTTAVKPDQSCLWVMLLLNQ